MEQIEIKSGPAEILNTGTIIAFKDNPIEITVGPPERGFKLIIKFIDTKDYKLNSSDPQIDAKEIDSKTLEVNLINFQDPLGSGNLVPALIGKDGENELYLNFRVFHFKGGDKTFQYTFYKKEVI